MRRLLLGLVFLTGCAAKEAPLPPVPPMPEDLSTPQTWQLPAPVVLPPVMAPAAQPVPLPPPGPNEQRYPWTAYTEYPVPVQLGWPVTVVFAPNELVLDVADGDRAPQADGEERWQWVKTRSELDGVTQDHLILTCTHVGQALGLVASTTQRLYALSAACMKQTPVRVVRWSYPPTPVPVQEPPPRLFPAPQTPVHVGYVVEGPPMPPDFLPRYVVDDGQRTYLLFSPVVLHQQAPLLRLIGPNGPEVVNYQQYDTVYIIPQLIAHAELRYGVGEHAQIVTIRRGTLRTLTCPGEPGCPAWPDLPTALAKER